MDRIHYDDEGTLIIPFDFEHEALAALETNLEQYIKECPPGEKQNIERLSRALEAVNQANRLVSLALSGCPTSRRRFRTRRPGEFISVMR
jgi:hypothetical protein